MLKTLTHLSAVILLFILGGCEKNTSPTSPPAPPFMAQAPTSSIPAPPLITPNPQTLVLWAYQQQFLITAAEQAQKLHASIDALLTSPTNESLSQSQYDWQQLTISLEKTAIVGEINQYIHFPAGTEFFNNYQKIGLAPTHLGYLDDDGVHGKTGLIYDIDTPINLSALQQQQKLTSEYDATLGASALGAVLMGANGARDYQDFYSRQTLTDGELIQGYSLANELPENRRRELVRIQSQELLDNINLINHQWQDRERASLINAFSQQSSQEQVTTYLKATKSLCQMQLTALTTPNEFIEESSEDFQHWQQRFLYQRWQAQHQGLSEWATIVDMPWLRSQSEELQNLLQQLIDTPNDTTTAAINSGAAENTPKATAAVIVALNTLLTQLYKSLSAAKNVAEVEASKQNDITASAGSTTL